MEIPKGIVERLTQTVDPRKPTISSDAIVRYLERNGWHRDIAGDDDFNLAVCAIAKAHDCGRGIFVAGDPGCGKTALLKVLQKNYGGAFLYCKDQDHLNLMRNRYKPESSRAIFIDDLGCEEIVKEYGNTIDVVGDYLQFLHTRFDGRVFISSNQGLKWMNERYGGRVMDRVLEMCVCFKMKGRSKRERMVMQ